MPLIPFKPADVLDPGKSEITLLSEEDAPHRDGVVCDQQFFTFDDAGKSMMEMPRPHHHLVVTGKNPDASPRYYPV